MPPVVVVCPTFKKFDLCIGMIASAKAGNVAPDAFIILDNSAGGFNVYCQEQGVSLGDNVVVVTTSENLGVACGWNYLLEQVRARIPYALCIVTNDDISFYEDTIEKLVCAAVNDAIDNDCYNLIYCCGAIEAPNAFSLFLTHPQTLFDAIGRFDSSISPAYHEDGDMHYRMKLAGYDLTRVEDCNADHGTGSATLKSFDADETTKHHRQFRRNQEYYERKWGGLPGKETYLFPFNNEDIMQHMLDLHKRHGF